MLRAVTCTDTYDHHGNVLESWEYDWVNYSSVQRSQQSPYCTGFPTGTIPGGAQLLRHTVNTYTVPAGNAATPNEDDPYAYFNLNGSEADRKKSLRLLDTGTGYNGSGTTASYVNLDYDTRGNVTAETRSVDGSSQIARSFVYDTYGNRTQTTNGRGFNETVDYQSCGGIPMYPQTIERGLSVPEYQETLLNSSCSTGLLLSSTRNEVPAKAVVTSYVYDSLGRLIEIQEGNQSTTTEIAYSISPSERKMTVTSPGPVVIYEYFDQLWRTSRTHNAATNIQALSEYQTGGGVNYSLVSNPHSASGNPDGWTLTRKDTANRVTSVETFAGSGKPAPFGSNSTSTGAVTTSYAADLTTVTDQAGKARQNRTDALGRLVQVIEDPSGLNYTTTYAYNALDSLTGVTQGSQTRTFAYDWLGRLTSATNPESGTTTYQYDGNGNLTSRTDALSRTTTMFYDRVDRVTLKDYPAGTPDVTYCYDGKVASGSPGVCQAGSGSGYPVRQLTEVSTSASKTDYTYDALGRPLTSTQTTGAPYSFSYAWNAASALTSVTYPSGKTVNYCFDSAYRPVGVRTGSGSCTPGTAGVYAGNGGYAPHGALAQLQLGNSLWETAQYNSRLQPSAIKLGTSAGSDSVFGSALDYGTTNNNGNVLSQTITGSGLSKTQTYTYDGRGTSATTRRATGGCRRGRGSRRRVSRRSRRRGSTRTTAW